MTCVSPLRLKHTSALITLYVCVTHDGVFNTHICFPIFAIFNSGNPNTESSVTNKRSLLPVHDEMVLLFGDTVIFELELKLAYRFQSLFKDERPTTILRSSKS
jgi:hypothetical protein